MARLLGLGNIGRVVTKHNSFKAEVDTYYLGKRYKISGPSRGQDEQQAQNDLALIRASAGGSESRLEGLQAMKSEAQRLQDIGKGFRTFDGGIEEGSAYSNRARIQYWEDSTPHAVRGPVRSLIFWESAAPLGPCFFKA